MFWLCQHHMFDTMSSGQLSTIIFLRCIAGTDVGFPCSAALAVLFHMFPLSTYVYEAVKFITVSL